ncbi:glutaredoxin family protein [Janthinobacterium sp. PC23-8]|uniref:glutaredoxin family protein n=1 Tax=Janthinobacterium sp. PC23-8 TaxID=2012679 RepID=UPI000B96B4E3|nr:glutaredoxin family protein [Janthinobacterium sp. PC23-8]OYO29946.1 thioredoxin family protein [Janthinobacterium sp. PC23-8]
MHFTLYSRSYCHLCQDMFDALQGLQTAARSFTVEVIDIDTSPDPALLVRFDELVPVLYGDLAQPELCHYFLDEAAVRRYLA